VGPTAGLDTVAKRKIPIIAPCQELKPGLYSQLHRLLRVGIIMDKWTKHCCFLWTTYWEGELILFDSVYEDKGHIMYTARNTTLEAALCKFKVNHTATAQAYISLGEGT
jgi:hypothetical protein